MSTVFFNRFHLIIQNLDILINNRLCLPSDERSAESSPDAIVISQIRIHQSLFIIYRNRLRSDNKMILPTEAVVHAGDVRHEEFIGMTDFFAGWIKKP